MKNIRAKFITFGLTASLFLGSCTKVDDEIVTQQAKSTSESVSKTGKLINGKQSIVPGLINSRKLPASFLKEFNLDPRNVITASECDSNTPFNQAYNASVRSNLDQLGLDWYYDYVDFNFYYTITDESVPYFGAEGQYTNFVNKTKRDLEKFWNMPNEVSVRGQHNETLNNKAKIIQILTFWYGFSMAEAQDYADYFVDYVNVESKFLTETPLISFDGFAIALDGYLGQGDLIVIGDGIVEILTKTGIEDKVIWTGILAHEWAHQIQFNNEQNWYPNGAADNAPEATRTTELEADFFAAYFMTHKSGATYNWKRIEDFLKIYYNIGDCSFLNSGHHGTPLQRMKSAKFGSDLAMASQKNGHILSANQVHSSFITSLNEIVSGN